MQVGMRQGGRCIYRLKVNYRTSWLFFSAGYKGIAHGA